MLTVKDLEYELARRDFPTFLSFVKILEPYPGRGEIAFEPWPHLLDISSKLQTEQLIAWVKSRQLGCSWLVAAFTLWKAMYNEGAHVLEFAQSEPKAADLITKQKYIYMRLPPELQEPVKSLDNQLQILFHKSDAWIKAFPSTKDAARGETGTMAWFDEADFHEYFEGAYSATKPVVDDIGGQIILTSTINPEAALEGSTFQTLYSNAPDNGFCKVFYGWRARPNRDQEWYNKAQRESTNPYTFTKEHAETEAQALAPPDSITFFRHPVLDEMAVDCRKPYFQIGQGDVYQPYQIGKKYVAGTDTSHGIGGDDAVTVVLDVATGLVVADIQSALLPPEELADQSVRLLEHYHSPLWAIEDNEWGGQTVRKAIALHYPRLYYRKDEQPGWHTGVHNRNYMWGELAEAIHGRALTIPNEKGLAQFYSVIRNAKKAGRVEAQRGRHDDYPLALSLAWQMTKQPGGAAKGGTTTGAIFLSV